MSNLFRFNKMLRFILLTILFTNGLFAQKKLVLMTDLNNGWAITKKSQPYPTHPLLPTTPWLIDKRSEVLNDQWTKKVVKAEITNDQIIPVSNTGNHAKPIWIAENLCNYFDHTYKASTYNFRNTFFLSDCINIKSASLQFTTDNICRIYINGRQIKRNGGWYDFPGGGLQCQIVCNGFNAAVIDNPPAYKMNSESMATNEIADIKEYLTPGVNVIAVENLNTGGCDINYAWICMNMEIEYEGSNLYTEAIDIKHFDCANRGSFTVKTSDGLEPLSYKIPGHPTQQHGHFTDLDPGIYEVLVTDASGCESTVRASIQEWVIKPELIVDDFDINTDCLDTSTFIKMVPKHEGYNLSFSLDGAPYEFVSQFTSLGTGPHTLRAINEFGCESEVYDFEVFYDKGYIYRNQHKIICHGEVAEIFGKKYDRSIIVSDTITALAGCDTIDRIDLRVEEKKQSDLTYELCDGDTIFAGNDYYIKEGDYVQHLTGQSGCDSTLKIRISYRDERICAEGACDFYVPNVFSPNFDGINDYFDVRNRFATIQQLTIYDRWGKTIYYGSDPDPVWDGTYRGKPMGSGVYIYMIKAKCFNGFPIIKKGGITLVK